MAAPKKYIQARNEQIDRAREQARRVARIADDYRGQDTLVLDLTGVTPIADFFVITTAANKRQMHAIAEEVDRALKEEGARRLGVEGYDGESWVLQDYGDIVLHILTPESRTAYDLEHLWADAVRVPWQPEGESTDTAN